jgi:hypothetical protein
MPLVDDLAPPAGRRRADVRRVVQEVVLMGVLVLAYQASRLLGGRDVAAAYDNARTVLHVERWLRLPGEDELQGLLLGVEPLVRAANAYYAAAHLPVTGLALLWLLLSRPQVYRRARRALLAGTAAALAVYLLLPVAPPRMLSGFVDTAAAYGQSVYGDDGASALANQYAALPSLHVGWSVLVALGCITASRTRWRWLWLAHPATTVLVVVLTGNHYWVDAAAGAALLVLTWQLAAQEPPCRSPRRPCPLAARARRARRPGALPSPRSPGRSGATGPGAGTTAAAPASSPPTAG